MAMTVFIQGEKTTSTVRSRSNTRHGFATDRRRVAIIYFCVVLIFVQIFLSSANVHNNSSSSGLLPARKTRFFSTISFHAASSPSPLAATDSDVKRIVHTASIIPVIKEVEGIMDPAAFAVVRFSLTTIPFIPLVLRARDDVETRNSGIELGFWVSLGYLKQALGMLTSDAGRTSFISMFTVIVVPLLDGVLGVVVPAHTWVGALMSLIAVALLESSGSPPTVNLVFKCVHCCSLFWTLTMVLDWMIIFPWIPALYNGVFSTELCLWVKMAAMSDVSATEAAIIYGLEPVWGAGFAWYLRGERWGISGWVGAILVLGGSLTVQILGASSPSSSKEPNDVNGKEDHLLVSRKQNGLSVSRIVVTSKKDISLKK